VRRKATRRRLSHPRSYLAENDGTPNNQESALIGNDMMRLIERLYPLPRSITGNGVRRTLEILTEWIPLEVTEIPTGTAILDWKVPKEWNISEAWIKAPDGTKIVDFADSNLHVVSYSAPMHDHLSLADLQAHLHSLPENPEAVPYRTAYFDDTWGFCLPDSLRSRLPEGDYEVYIDSSLGEGSLTYAEFFLPGRTDREIVLSAHTCHPSLANDNLSGIAVAAAMGRQLLGSDPGRFGLRIIFAPATFGSIAWLAQNADVATRIHAGLTLVCLGDAAPITYKRTVFGDEQIDRVASRAVSTASIPGETINFYPFGYDERQYNSPGFRIPFGSLMRSRHGAFPEYHSSQDDPEFVSATQLEHALDVVAKIVDQLQTDRRFRNLSPKGEPQLGKRGLYTSVQNAAQPQEFQLALLWVLNLSDGDHGLMEISKRSGIAIETIDNAAKILVHHGLLEELV